MLVLEIIELDIAREDSSRDCLENRFSPSQLGQENSGTGSRILAVTLRNFSLFC